MPVNLIPTDPAQLAPVKGVRIGVVEAGIRKADRKDLTVFLLDQGSSVGGVFTTNRFCAAPVQVCRSHLASGAEIRALVINTGNANAGTGETGLGHANATCQAMADLLAVSAQQVLPFSTGVIMEPLPVERLVAGLPAALAALTRQSIIVCDELLSGNIRPSHSALSLTPRFLNQATVSVAPNRCNGPINSRSPR